MTQTHETYQTRRASLPMVALVVGCLAVVVVTLVGALWNDGAFLPRWVQWTSLDEKIDVNGNHQIETVHLSNRHLTMIDSQGNHYVTPNDWMISHVEIVDVNNDGTPEVSALLWVRDSENATYQLPFLDFMPGFSQRIYIFDYQDGAIEPVWYSKPLSFEASSLSLNDKDRLVITSTTGEEMLLNWENFGFALKSDTPGKSAP